MKELSENRSGTPGQPTGKRNKGNAFFWEERGDILLLAAVFMTVLIFFAGIAVDFSVIYMEKSALDDYCQIARECRFTHDNRVIYAEDPGLELSRIVERALRENGFPETGSAVLLFSEEPPTECRRSYTAKLMLSEECPTCFLRLFRLDRVRISSEIEFSDEFGLAGGEEADADLGEEMTGYLRVWHPVLVEGGYQGKYELFPG